MVLAPTADRGLLPPAASMAGERRGCAFVFIAQEKAMSNIIDLGGTPANEDCAQIGHTPDFERLNRLEVATYRAAVRSEEHTSELQSLMRISYAVFCLKK